MTTPAPPSYACGTASTSTSCTSNIDLLGPAIVESRHSASEVEGNARQDSASDHRTNDTSGAADEIATFEKNVERPEDLGLSLAEGKAVALPLGWA
jgi:hypothetical protein